MTAVQDHQAKAAKALEAAVSGTRLDNPGWWSDDDPRRLLLALTGVGHALLADVELRTAQQPAPLPPRRRLFWRGAR